MLLPHRPKHHGLAVPERLEVCVPAESEIDRVALFAPADRFVCGLNCTTTVHAAPGANVVRDVPHVVPSPTIANSVGLLPTIVAAPIPVIVTLPVLVSVKVWVGSKKQAKICANVVPGHVRAWVPKSCDTGVRDAVAPPPPPLPAPNSTAPMSGVPVRV